MWPFACRFRWRLLTRDGPRSACAPQVVTGEVRGAGCASPASLTFFGEDGACPAARAPTSTVVSQGPPALPGAPSVSSCAGVNLSMLTRPPPHTHTPPGESEELELNHDDEAGFSPGSVRRAAFRLELPLGSLRCVRIRLRDVPLPPGAPPDGWFVEEVRGCAPAAPAQRRRARRVGSVPVPASVCDSDILNLKPRCGCFGPPRDTRTAFPVGGGWALRTPPAAAFPGSRRLTW